MPAQPSNGFLIHYPSLSSEKIHEGMALKIRREERDSQNHSIIKKLEILPD
jgi:hypothetical protein